LNCRTKNSVEWATAVRLAGQWALDGQLDVTAAASARAKS